jgi:hypothetical protein
VEAGGQKVFHVDAIRSVRSVDVVTHPAAGGGFVRLVASQPPDPSSAVEQYLPVLQAVRAEMARTKAELTMSELLADCHVSPDERRQIMALFRESLAPSPA